MFIREERRVHMKGITLALFAIAIGMFAGLLYPQSAKATIINVELRVYGGATSYMTCGWHGDCGPSPTSGKAIDWDNPDEGTVYWRSYGYRDDGQTATIATGTTSHPAGPACNTVIVSLADAFSFSKGEADYVHTATWFPGTNFNISGSPTWSWTPQDVGFSVTSEDTGCSFTGSHLHEVQGSLYWAQQANTGNSCSGYYPDYRCQGYTKSSYLSLGSWQFKQGWVWNLP
jgi:hypothetical protein